MSSQNNFQVSIPFTYSKGFFWAEDVKLIEKCVDNTYRVHLRTFNSYSILIQKEEYKKFCRMTSNHYDHCL